MPLNKNRLKLKNGYLMIPMDPNEVQIRTGTWWAHTFVLHDVKKRGTLEKFICLLDGTRTQDELIEKMGKEDCQEYISDLKTANLLEEVSEGVSAPLPTKEAKRYNLLTPFFEMSRRRPELYLSSLRKGKIALIGNGALGSRLAIQLAQLGIGNIGLLDDKQITENDVIISPYFTPKDIGKPRSSIIKSRVRKVNPHIECDLLRGALTSEDSLEAIMQTFDLVIASEDWPNLMLYEKMNAAALKNKAMWSIVTIDGAQGIVGPTMIGRSTACYKCYEMHIESNLKHYLQYLKYREAIKNKRNVFGAQMIGLPAHADFLTSILCCDIPDLLTLRTGYTLGKVIVTDLLNIVIEVNDVLKLPRCLACGRISKGRTDHPLFTSYHDIIGS